MSFSLQQIPAERKLSHVLRLPVLEQVYPRERIVEWLTRCHRWEERERKLSQLLMVYYVISLWLRKQLGIAVLRQLFRQSCVPLATPQTPGAFQFGLRLMALDGTLDEVPDSPANATHFGRLTQGHSRSPFPQVRCL